MRGETTMSEKQWTIEAGMLVVSAGWRWRVISTTCGTLSVVDEDLKVCAIPADGAHPDLADKATILLCVEQLARRMGTVRRAHNPAMVARMLMRL